MLNDHIFQKRRVLVTGGTGSFGNAVIQKLLNVGVDEIVVLSRDEKKQNDMRSQLSRDELRFFVGDVRDLDAVDRAMAGIDFVFHAAALKQVPSCEFFPMEAVKTNIIGTDNVLNSAMKNNVSKVVCLSTDKAAYPISAMGISKAMMEKVATANARYAKNTIICTTRYGNVLATRGSVIPLFLEQIKANKPLTITDKSMTRFVMTIDEAVNLVIHAFIHAEQGDLFVQKSSAASIQTMLSAVLEVMGLEDYPTETIGIRHGEKLFEVLLSAEEMFKAKDEGQFFRIPADARNLNYNGFVDEGRPHKRPMPEEYNSNNTTQLSLEQFIAIMKDAEILNQSMNLN